MSKDSYWFRHDSTAGRAIEMRKMAHIYGHWGKGIYWDVIEILRDQSKYTFECDDFELEMLCDLIGCKDPEKFIKWFHDCVRFKLLEILDKNKFHCPALTKNMVKWESSKVNGGKGGRPKKNPTNNPTETQLKPNPEPNGNHNSTVQYSTGDNNKNILLVKKRFLDTNFDQIYRVYETSQEPLKNSFNLLYEKNKNICSINSYN